MSMSMSVHAKNIHNYKMRSPKFRLPQSGEFCPAFSMGGEATLLTFITYFTRIFNL